MTLKKLLAIEEAVPYIFTALATNSPTIWDFFILV